MTGAPWDRRRLFAVATGGAAGAGVRWLAVVWAGRTGEMPWEVLAVNVAGSFLLGVLLAEEWTHPSARVALHDAGAIGFCGGLTTFSTFSVEVVDLVREGHGGVALTYGVLSVALTLVAVVVGAGLFRRVRALTLPLEERP